MSKSWHYHTIDQIIGLHGLKVTYNFANEPLLSLGGTTAAYPGLKAVAGGLLQVRKADDSGYAVLQSGFTQANIVDAGTATQPVALELYHDTNAGTPAVSCGVSMDFRADSDTTDRQLQVRLVSLWSDATHATRTAHMRIQPVLNGTATEALRISNAAVDLRSGAALQIAGVAYHNPLTVYASGTGYAYTTSDAGLDFATTDPILTINAPGTYLIRAIVRVNLSGATYGSTQTVTNKLRRTNNSAADVANSSTTWTIPVVTTAIQTLGVIPLPDVIYTTSNSNDTLQIFGSLSQAPSAGSVAAVEASIVAIRLS